MLLLVCIVGQRVPPQVPYVPAPLAAEPDPEAKADARVTLEAFPHWGGGWSSAAEDGAHFFDRARAQELRQAAGAQARYVIDLNARAILPDPAVKPEELVPAGAPRTLLLQFKAQPSEAQKQELARAGVEVIRYLDGHAYHARGTREAFAAARAKEYVRALAKLDARDKLHPQVFAGRKPEYAKLGEGIYGYRLLAYPGARLDELKAAVGEAGASLVPQAPSVLGPMFGFSGDDKAILALAALPQARFVNYLPPPPAKRDATTDQNTNVTDVRDGPLALSGAGVEVAVREVEKTGTGIQPTPEDVHVDIELNYIDEDFDSGAPFDPDHATSVNGQIGGQGVQVPNAKGIAPGVFLHGYDLYPLNIDAFATDDIVNADELLSVRLSNHSYGPTGEGDGSYDTISADWDQVLRDGALGEGLLAMIASAEISPIRHKQIDFFSGMKNSICVSATNDTAHCGDDDPATPVASGIASFVDFGPMLDSRIKPDCVAPGTTITLIRGLSSSTVNNGTSFASPVVTGILALIFEHYINRNLGLEPSAALAKGILLNGCTDIGKAGPDARYGWGICNAEKSVDLITRHFDTPADPLFFEGAVGTNDTDEYLIGVSGAETVKVMLVWLDAGGDPMAAKALVNDLDLEVVNPSATTLFPFSLNVNSFGASPQGNEQNDPPATTTGANRQDTVEQVVVVNPPSGAYTIRVKGFNVPYEDNPGDGQRYAVVVCKGAAISATLACVPEAPGKNVSGVTYFPVGGGNANFTVNIAGGVAPYTIDWDLDGDDTVDSTDVTNSTSFAFPANPYMYPAVVDADDDFYLAKATITDSSVPPFVTTATRPVTVLVPPTAIAAGAPDFGEAPLNVFFNGSASLGVIETYTWDFGDSSMETNPVPTTTHLYEDVGLFGVTLTVTDVVGQTGSDNSLLIETTKRLRTAYTQRFVGSVNYLKRTGRFALVLVTPDLALSSLAYRNALQAQTYAGRGYDFYINGDETTGELLATFVTDKYARNQPRDRYRSFRILLLRRGWILITWSVKDDPESPGDPEAVATIFEDNFMGEFDPSTDKNDPLTDIEFPVAVDTQDATYRATFKLIFTNIRGIAGRVIGRKP
ncbi:MAG: S8 family serine peptidase [Planctomycetota bacterium]|nr:S8 family serine peptidase [Planctomycetota bacterium]